MIRRFCGPKALRAATILAIVACVVSASVLLVSGGFFFVSRAHAAQKIADQAGLRREIGEAQATLKKVRAAPSAAPMKAAEASGLLQDQLETVASREGCELTEYRASDEVSSFVTRYAKDTKERSWSQTSVRATLTGPGPKIVATLATLRATPVPIEVDSIQFTRSGTSGDGTGTVTAEVELRLLTQGGA